VEIKQSDGRTLLSQINRGGTRQVLEGTPPFSVVIGNAPAVHMRYNDESIDLKPHFRVDVARLTLE
jgi:cytoskeleton protein RodZ